MLLFDPEAKTVCFAAQIGAGVLLLAGICIAGCLGSDYPGNGTFPAPGITSGNEIPLFVTLDPVGRHRSGDTFTITGTTNLPEDRLIRIDIHEELLPRKPAMNSTFYGLMGNATLKKGPDGITRWAFEVNATGLIPQKYFVDVSAGDPGPALSAGGTLYLAP
jgi:hypothetical protein